MSLFDELKSAIAKFSDVALYVFGATLALLAVLLLFIESSPSVCWLYAFGAACVWAAFVLKEEFSRSIKSIFIGYLALVALQGVLNLGFSGNPAALTFVLSVVIALPVVITVLVMFPYNNPNFDGKRVFCSSHSAFHS
jgi:hypothetical protein